MNEGNVWSSKKGIWMVDDGTSTPSVKALNNKAKGVKNGAKPTLEEIMKAYGAYLLKARTKPGKYDWSIWNAKRLVWELGNVKTLTSIRNAVSGYKKDTGYDIPTLRAGVKAALDPAEKEARNKRIFENAGIAQLIQFAKEDAKVE